jgi:hypothetical protein
VVKDSSASRQHCFVTGKWAVSTGTRLLVPMFSDYSALLLILVVKDLSAFRQDCFVTGKWAVGQDAEELLNLDKEDEEEVSFCPFRLSDLT